jgi:hypothetical protein
MELEGNYRELGEISAGELAHLQQAVVNALPSEWDSELRQRHFQAHKDTSSIILCFSPDDDLAAASYTPAWARWEPMLGALLDRVTAEHFGPGKLIRLMIVRLYAGCSVVPHTDDLPVLHISHRVHIPIRTTRSVIFVVDNQIVPMREGQIVEINNQRIHHVTNAGAIDRIHLIFDYATADQLERAP